MSEKDSFEQRAERLARWISEEGSSKAPPKKGAAAQARGLIEAEMSERGWESACELLEAAKAISRGQAVDGFSLWGPLLEAALEEPPGAPRVERLERLMSQCSVSRAYAKDRGDSEFELQSRWRELKGMALARAIMEIGEMGDRDSQKKCMEAGRNAALIAEWDDPHESDWEDLWGEQGVSAARMLNRKAREGWSASKVGEEIMASEIEGEALAGLLIAGEGEVEHLARRALEGIELKGREQKKGSWGAIDGAWASLALGWADWARLDQSRIQEQKKDAGRASRCRTMMIDKALCSVWASQAMKERAESIEPKSAPIEEWIQALSEESSNESRIIRALEAIEASWEAEELEASARPGSRESRPKL